MKTIMKPIRFITNLYNKLTTCGKALVIIVIMLLFVILFNQHKNHGREGFEESKTFEFKEGTQLYDDFYSNIYDNLVFNDVKNEYEIGEIIKQTKPTSENTQKLRIWVATAGTTAALASAGTSTQLTTPLR